MQRRDPRHDILFEPVQIGPKRLRNRFYQVPHCSWLRRGQALLPSRAPGDQGRGRLGGGLHRIRPRQHRIGREPGGRRPHVGLGRRRQPRGHVRPGPRVRVARRDRAEPLRRPRHVRRGAGALDCAVPAGERLHLPHRAEGDGPRRHRPHPPRLGGGGQEGSRRRLRHRVCVRGAFVSADAVSVGVLQPPDRWVWRELREPGPFLAGAPRPTYARPSGRTAPSPTGSLSPRSGRRASSSTSRSASSRPPTTSSTCGTSTSGRSASGRRTRELHVSSGRAINWNGPEG